MAPRYCCDLPLLQLCRANKAPPYTVCLTRTTRVPQDLPLFSIILCLRFSAEVAFPANTAKTTAQRKPKVGRNVLLCTQNMTNPSAKPSVGRPVGLALQSCTGCSWSGARGCSSPSTHTGPESRDAQNFQCGTSHPTHKYTAFPCCANVQEPCWESNIFPIFF